MNGFATPTLHPKAKDESGKVYGKLTVLEYVGKEKHFSMWRCRCECGKVIVTRSNSLRTGNTKACSSACGRVRHGHSIRGRKSAEYRCWQAMIARCTNPRQTGYHNYGGRGIMICERWQSFENFIADMGPRPSPRHSLDRKDNNGHYEPGNCRWATKIEQDNNRRTNRLIEFGGRTLSITQWARELGVHPVTLHIRLKNGWTVEKTLTTPKMT